MKKKITINLLITVFSISYFLTFQNYGLNLWDEGGLLNGSLRTLEGESVYTDFNGYPPGRYLLGAILFKIFGINISVIRIAVAVMTAVAVVMLYSISLRIIPPPPPLVKGGKGGLAIIPPVLFLISPAVYYNRFYPIFTIFGIYVIYWYLEKRTPYRSILLAISAILSMFFKLEIGIGIVAISMVIMLLKLGSHPEEPALNSFQGCGYPVSVAAGFSLRKNFIYFFFTLGLFLILTILYYSSSIDIYRLIYDTSFQIFRVYEVWGNPFPDIFSLELWERFNIHEIFSVLLFYIPLIIYFLTFIILIRNPLTLILSPEGRGKGEGELRTPIAIILFFGIYTYNLVIWRTGFDNLIRCLPPALILGSYLLYLFRMKLFQWTGERIFSYAVILLLPLWFLYEMIFYGDFYTGSIGEMRKPHAPLSIERAENIYTDPVEVSWIKEIAEHIRNNTKPEDTIFAIPLNPIWYFLTDRKNPTYYEWILPGELKTEAEQRKVIEQLKKKIPLFIIYADIAIDNRGERRFSNYAPLIYSFITENYRIEKIVGFFQVLRYGKEVSNKK